MHWKSIVLQDAPRSCVAVFFLDVSLSTTTMEVLFVLQCYHPDKTDKSCCLIHGSGTKMAVKMSSVVKQFRVTRWPLFLSINLFGSVVETTRIMYRVSGFGYDPKNPPPLWIIWINNPFWIL